MRTAAARTTSRQFALPPGTKVAWEPLAGSQTLAVSCPANIILVEGTRGPGKSEGQLAFFRKYVGMGYGSQWRGIIFDREYKNLDDLIVKGNRLYTRFKDGCRWMSSRADYKFVWPSGEELLIRSIKKANDYWNYHGQEFPFIGWNELTKYPTSELYDAMASCNRSSFLPLEHSPEDSTGEVILLPEIPLVTFATCNPYGAGHRWVKKKFIDVAPPGKIVRTTVNVFNPRTQLREDVTKTQVRIFGSYKENRFLSPEYVATLESISDVNKRKAWLWGDWDIVAGGMFDAFWDESQHVVKPFKIPHTWRITRSFDYGSSRPFSVGWWAISDGTDYQLQNGKWKSSVRGDLYRIAEWYGCSGKPNEGINMLATDIARGIVNRQIKMGIHQRVQPGPADGSIWDSQDGNSIAASMSKDVKIDGNVYRGVQWTRADKSPGSRIAGWDRINEYFKNALVDIKNPLPREKPGLFAFATCMSYKDLMPTLPRDDENPDDADTEAEDHLPDEVRYMVASMVKSPKSGSTKGT